MSAIAPVQNVGYPPGLYPPVPPPPPPPQKVHLQIIIFGEKNGLSI